MRDDSTLGPLLGVVVTVLMCVSLSAQATPNGPAPKNTAKPWSFNLTTDGYIVPNEQGYVNPTFTADHGWLHLEARYNYEDFHTGSLWFGRNFKVGNELVFKVTPMLGGVFGRTTGIAPGCEASLAYKKVEISISNEYVFDTSHSSGSFYYAWPQLTYSPWSWLNVGLVAQHTQTVHTSFALQRGFLVGTSYKDVEFTTYVFNPEADPTVVLEVGFSF